MKKAVFFVLALSFSDVALAQPDTFINDHKYHIGILTHAKDSLYQLTLQEFDRYIARHPSDYKAQLERCRYIEKAYYDEADDYNPKYDETMACAQSLAESFPENPEVLLYQTEFMYGDSLRSYLIDLKNNARDTSWDKYRWNIYKLLAEQYHYDETYKESIEYSKLAVSGNDTLDLTLLLGEAHKELGQKALAIDYLSSRLDSTSDAWVLNRKGNLLLELGATDEAIRAFTLAANKSEMNENTGALAQAFIDKGLIDEARVYLVKDLRSTGSWNEDEKRHKLLKYDLQYGSADSAKVSYAKFVDANFFNDAFAIYRLRLFFKNPLLSWSFGDAGRVLLLILLFAVAIIIPYLWILPIYAFGNYQRQQGTHLSPGTFHWGLRHFWLASSLWFISSILASLIFDYPGILSYFNNYIESEYVEGISKNLANLNLFFFSSLLVFSITMLRKEDIIKFIPKFSSSASSVGTGIGLAFLLKFGLGIYLIILKSFGFDSMGAAPAVSSMQDHIVSINTFYNPFLGFLFVVILVPFYEEILFRGIFLSASERNMKFIFANIIQSLLFALVHMELYLIPFYFAFGMLAGYYTRRTGSLITGTSMHMMNNLLAFLFLLK